MRCRKKSNRVRKEPPAWKAIAKSDSSPRCSLAASNIAFRTKPGVDRKTLRLVKPDMVHVYDLELAEDVVPKPHDDEVKEFYLMTPDEVKTALLNKEFKTNSAAAMIDFFIRHGIITADNEVDYPELSMRLHRTLPFSTAPRL